MQVAHKVDDEKDNLGEFGHFVLEMSSSLWSRNQNKDQTVSNLDQT